MAVINLYIGEIFGEVRVPSFEWNSASTIDGSIWNSGPAEIHQRRCTHTPPGTSRSSEQFISIFGNTKIKEKTFFPRFIRTQHVKRCVRSSSHLTPRSDETNQLTFLSLKKFHYSLLAIFYFILFSSAARARGTGMKRRRDSGDAARRDGLLRINASRVRCMEGKLLGK